MQLQSRRLSSFWMEAKAQLVVPAGSTGWQMQLQ